MIKQLVPPEVSQAASDDILSLLAQDGIRQSDEDHPNMIQPPKSSILFDLWACQRPLTKAWGSGQVFTRIEKILGRPDCAFGKTDNIPDNVFYVDRSNGFEWLHLPFSDNTFNFGYWDPPYDKMYKREGIEIWRTCRRLAILHTFMFPRAWLKDAAREAVIAITMGPLKQIRCLQVFRKLGADDVSVENVGAEDAE